MILTSSAREIILASFGSPPRGVRTVPRRAAYAIVKDQRGHILVVHGRNGLFLPGGGIETAISGLSALHNTIPTWNRRKLTGIHRQGGPATQYRRLWASLALVVVASFAVLGYYGWEIYHAAPPIATEVRSQDGSVLFTSQQIQDGQSVQQSIGGHELGSVWGHGADSEQ